MCSRAKQLFGARPLRFAKTQYDRLLLGPYDLNAGTQKNHHQTDHHYRNDKETALQRLVERARSGIHRGFRRGIPRFVRMRMFLLAHLISCRLRKYSSRTRGPTNRTAATAGPVSAWCAPSKSPRGTGASPGKGPARGSSRRPPAIPRLPPPPCPGFPALSLRHWRWFRCADDPPCSGCPVPGLSLSYQVLNVTIAFLFHPIKTFCVMLSGKPSLSIPRNRTSIP